MLDHSNTSSSSESLLALPNRWKSLNSSSHDDEVKESGSQYSTSTLMESGLLLWLSWQRTCLQCGRPGFDPRVGKIPWRRERQPTPIFWPEEFLGQRSLAGYSPWGLKELDTTE